MTAKVKPLVGGGQTFWCPGCKESHAVNQRQDGPHWSYNGNPESPTFSPSILVTLRWSQHDDTWKDDVCHSFVKDGRIQFLGDCTHELAGQTVDIPDWPYAVGEYGGIEEEHQK